MTKLITFAFAKWDILLCQVLQSAKDVILLVKFVKKILKNVLFVNPEIVESESIIPAFVRK